ncbi:nucleotidyltransferase family protein [Paenibacillus sp. UNC499MF]|uniref:nucleotidyltransferase domain-containing protein n=1 Tax=Paenibacillus sp. UNC499MF TaxID=1502751 RepID=UPI0008A08A9A|nr:nucleotidyltransferase family protein [Paenibacillus sp. UNC499MF]SEF80699.1 Uncharacterised nucleotidyltransferase [Paenibacillus sp. UNC499MF]
MTQPLVRFLNDLYVDHGAFSFTEEEYGQIAEDLDLFSITAQVYHMLKEKGRLGELPLFLQEHLKRKAEATLFQNLLLKTETDRLLRLFEEAELSVMLLKGVHFAETYFGHTGARGTTDIDLLVEPQYLKNALEIVESAGYHIQETYGSDHHVVLQKNNAQRIQIDVEIHWALARNEFYKIDHKSFWLRSSPISDFSYVRQLSPEDVFYMICLHGAQHYMISPRYSLDILQLIQIQPQIFDWDDIYRRTKAEHTRHRMSLACTETKFFFKNCRMDERFIKKGSAGWEYGEMKAAAAENKKVRYYIQTFFFRLKSIDRLGYIGLLFKKMIIPSVSEQVHREVSSKTAGVYQIYRYRWRILRNTIKKIFLTSK